MIRAQTWDGCLRAGILELLDFMLRYPFWHFLSAFFYTNHVDELLHSKSSYYDLTYILHQVGRNPKTNELL